MKKSIKILFVAIILIILFAFNTCNAVPIDMNLASNTFGNTYSPIDDNADSNFYASNSTTNSPTSTVNNSSNINNPSSSGGSSSSVSSLPSLPESELGLTNILNILLIAVGFILILLAIAILIRLSKR